MGLATIATIVTIFSKLITTAVAAIHCHSRCMLQTNVNFILAQSLEMTSIRNLFTEGPDLLSLNLSV